MPPSPTSQTYTHTLTQAGLTAEQAQIYEILLKNGPSSARKVVQNTTLKRSLVYKILDDLIKLGLVEKADAIGKISIFTPAHPLKLKELVEKQEARAKTAQVALDGLMGSLTSDFNLISGRPGVQFFEGLEGIRKVAFDNLTAKTEILAYLDMATIQKYLKKMNDEYVLIRRRRGLKKLNLVNDTPENRKLLSGYNRDITDIRLIGASETPMRFASMMQIYDNKVSYITIDPERWIGVIIEDKNIADMHRQLYLSSWQSAKPLDFPKDSPAQ